MRLIARFLGLHRGVFIQSFKMYKGHERSKSYVLKNRPNFPFELLFPC